MADAAFDVAVSRYTVGGSAPLARLRLEGAGGWARVDLDRDAVVKLCAQMMQAVGLEAVHLVGGTEAAAW
jgi:hypothetical protein